MNLTTARHAYTALTDEELEAFAINYGRRNRSGITRCSAPRIGRPNRTPRGDGRSTSCAAMAPSPTPNARHVGAQSAWRPHDVARCHRRPGPGLHRRHRAAHAGRDPGCAMSDPVAAVQRLADFANDPAWDSLWTFFNAFASGKMQGQWSRAEPLAVLGELYQRLAILDCKRREAIGKPVAESRKARRRPQGNASSAF